MSPETVNCPKCGCPIMSREEFREVWPPPDYTLGLEASDITPQERELRDRWEQVRKVCGAKTDDTVQEVFDRIEQHRAFWDSHGGPT